MVKIIRITQNVKQENLDCILRFDTAVFMINHQVYDGDFHKFSIFIISAKYKHIFGLIQM